jgi:hypothetical protein
MRTIKRVRQYKILATVILGSLLAMLVLQFWHLSQTVDSAGFELNRKTNERNYAYAKANPFGFTDSARTTQKPKGVYRIAVIGDSFIWGDGLPYEKVWSHKLESKMLAQYDSVQVLSWGQQGWSTSDEFNFYNRNGKDFGIDLLIVGWVDNDPDVGKVKQTEFGYKNEGFPLIRKLFPALAQSLSNKQNHTAYNLWLDKIYGPENLKDYQTVLDSFSRSLNHDSVKALFVLTSAAFDSLTRAHFQLVKPLLNKAGFAYFDLTEPTEKSLKHYTQLQLQANPVNGHPGDLMTEEFANQVQSYLEQNGYLKQLHKRGS